MNKTKNLLLLSCCTALLILNGCKKETVTPTGGGPAPCETQIWYQDADGDGKGNPKVSQEHCDQPDGYVLDNTDFIDKAIERKAVPALMKISGETCPPCGGWGWTAWEDLSHKKIGQAFCWTSYGTFVSNGNFRGQELTPTMQAFQDRFWKSGSKPSFAVNHNDYQSATTDAEQAVDDFIAVEPNMAAVLEATIEDDKLTITSEVEFYKDMPGEYVLGAYLVEDKVTGYQAGHADGNNAKHHYVMRGSLSDNAWGETIASAGATNGQKFEKTFTATIPANYNTENFSYGVIVWRKFGQAYVFQNAYTTQK